MIRAIVATLFGIAAMFGAAGTANADTESYLYILEQRGYGDLSPLKLIDVGYGACDLMERGIPATVLVERAVAETGQTRHFIVTVVGAAATQLCPSDSI
jgi:hypothetical protein